MPLGGGAGAIRTYASAQSLGLDRFAPGSDDVDALSLWDNGDGFYQPPTGPYSWIVPDASNAVTDLLLYSVRCGSDIVESFDMVGLPITEGDVLIKYAGDPRPTIFVRAETLGLDTTIRGGLFNDEMDGLDLVDGGQDPFTDCQPNGIEDAYDIASGSSPDDDLNGIPDDCEKPEVFCDCEAASSAPCNNSGVAGEGCVNVTGFGGRLDPSGTTSVSTDFLSLHISQLPANQFALVFMGSTALDVPLGNGRLCIGPSQIRLQVVGTNAMGQASYGPGIISYVTSLPSPPSINVGSTWGFQAWYRDLQSGCTSGGSNVTNGVLVVFTPECRVGSLCKSARPVIEPGGRSSFGAGRGEPLSRRYFLRRARGLRALGTFIPLDSKYSASERWASLRARLRSASEEDLDFSTALVRARKAAFASFVAGSAFIALAALRFSMSSIFFLRSAIISSGDLR